MTPRVTRFQHVKTDQETMSASASMDIREDYAVKKSVKVQYELVHCLHSQFVRIRNRRMLILRQSNSSIMNKKKRKRKKSHVFLLNEKRQLTLVNCL